MNGLEKIVARMESDTRAECDALAASAAENAAAYENKEAYDKSVKSLSTREKCENEHFTEF